MKTIFVVILALIIVGCVTPTDQFVVKQLNERIAAIENDHRILIESYSKNDKPDVVFSNKVSKINSKNISEAQIEFIMLMMDYLKK